MGLWRVSSGLHWMILRKELIYTPYKVYIHNIQIIYIFENSP